MNEKEQYRKFWKQRIEAYEQSGLTIRAWCEANQVKVHQFHYWRKKFKQANHTTLVPIELSKIKSPVNQEGSIKLHIGSVQVEIDSGFNPSLLKDVIKVLMELC